MSLRLHRYEKLFRWQGGVSAFTPTAPISLHRSHHHALPTSYTALFSVRSFLPLYKPKPCPCVRRHITIRSAAGLNSRPLRSYCGAPTGPWIQSSRAVERVRLVLPSQRWRDVIQSYLLAHYAHLRLHDVELRDESKWGAPSPSASGHKSNRERYLLL